MNNSYYETHGVFGRNDLIHRWSVENNDHILTGTSECRKCHKIYSPPIYDI